MPVFNKSFKHLFNKSFKHQKNAELLCPNFYEGERKPAFFLYDLDSSLSNLFLGRAAEATVAQLICVIVDRNAVFNKKFPA